MTYSGFFEVVMAGPGVGGPPPASGFRPYGYQRQLTEGQWPDILDIPTGLGKTAAVTGAWLYRRLNGDRDTPRRLVWCLPMRVLVEQTRSNVGAWAERAAPLFAERGLAAPRVWTLMGGEADGAWVERPEDPAILIGTQDMLLSRALMRGYGASRYRWPMDFALLHNDALWVFDEVQLMGAGLPTSAQLEAFRRNDAMPPAFPARTLWASATLRPDWLATVDFRRHLPDCRVLSLPDEDRQDARVARRFAAVKRIRRADAALPSGRKPDVKTYIDALCDDVAANHSGDAPTLVVVNRVARAQDVYRGLRRGLDESDSGTELLLVHARFRAAERSALNARLRALGAGDDVIIVATQAVEAGVDITSRHLFTELAPWSSLVQRFGRCNRGGEYDDASVHWLDIAADTDAQLALPYDADALADARRILVDLDSAASQDLPPVTEQPMSPHVLRKKDFLDLFNTEADLSGHDIDIAPYLRDPGSPQLQVFWREFDGQPVAEWRAAREELCPVAIGDLRDHVKAVRKRAWVWDTLAARWTATDADDLRPGQTVLLEARGGGYDTAVGFIAKSKDRVEPVASDVANVESESMEADPLTAGDYAELAVHLLDARREAEALLDALSLGDVPELAGAARAVVEAALWHDVGKAHAAFQTALLEHAGENVDRGLMYAKSPHARRLNYGVMVDGELRPRRYFRHELALMLAWLAQPASMAQPAVADSGDVDLTAYLIAAHHGKVRMSLRALPGETRPPDERLFARGVWTGDELPPLAVNGLRLPPVTLELDIMRLGEGRMGASWSARTARLLAEWGPFRLAWLETMVRLADWRASAQGGESQEGLPAPELVKDLVARIVRVAAPQRVVLFGSGARGGMDSDSDLDVLVVKPGDYHRGRLTERIYMALRGLGSAVDVIVAKPEDIDEFGDASALVFAVALREGRVIYAS